MKPVDSWIGRMVYRQKQGKPVSDLHLVETIIRSRAVTKCGRALAGRNNEGELALSNGTEAPTCQDCRGW